MKSTPRKPVPRNGCARSIASSLVVLLLIAALLLLLNARTPSAANSARTLERLAQTPSPAQPFAVSVALLSLDERANRHTPPLDACTDAAKQAVQLGAEIVVVHGAHFPATRAALKKTLAQEGFGETTYFSSGLVGSGLFIASRYAIEGIAYHRFRHAGDWYRPWEGDWYAGRGVGIACLRLSPAGPLLYIAALELQQRYEGSEHEHIRADQLREVETLAETLAAQGPLLIAGGFGFPSGDAEPQAFADRVRAVRLTPSEDRDNAILAVLPHEYRAQADSPASLKLVRGTLERHAGYVVRCRAELTPPETPPAPEASSAPAPPPADTATPGSS